MGKKAKTKSTRRWHGRWREIYWNVSRPALGLRRHYSAARSGCSLSITGEAPAATSNRMRPQWRRSPVMLSSGERVRAEAHGGSAMRVAMAASTHHDDPETTRKHVSAFGVPGRKHRMHGQREAERARVRERESRGQTRMGKCGCPAPPVPRQSFFPPRRPIASMFRNA